MYFNWGGKHTAYDQFSEYLMLYSLMYIYYAFMGYKSFINYFCPFLVYKNTPKVYISGDISALWNLCYIPVSYVPQLEQFWRYKLEIAHKYSLGLGIWHMFKPLCRRGKNTFKTYTQNLYRLKKGYFKINPSDFFCVNVGDCVLFWMVKSDTVHVCAKLSYRDLIEWCPQGMLHV